MKPYFKVFRRVCGNLAARNIRPRAWGEQLIDRIINFLLYLAAVVLFFIATGLLRW